MEGEELLITKLNSIIKSGKKKIRTIIMIENYALVDVWYGYHDSSESVEHLAPHESTAFYQYADHPKASRCFHLIDNTNTRFRINQTDSSSRS